MNSLEMLMLEVLRNLPYCSRRYSADQYGNIYQGNEKLQQTVVNDTLLVQLDWVNGRQLYSVALIILVCFNKLRLPDHLYQNVEVLYIDGNWRNVYPVNLIYRYKKGPIEVEEFPGYYYIPLYNDYAISRNGDLINIHTGKVKSWSITKEGGKKNQTGGYRYNRVVNDEGFSKILFLHRALCMVFKPYDRNLLSIVVNHKDGKPSNNNLDNLEWMTYKENNLHAVEIGMRPNSSAPILMLDLKTNIETRFPSIIACARHLGHERDTFIYRRLQHKPIKVFEDMLIFKYDNGEPWPSIDLNTIEICRSGTGSDMIARNVFTGETIIFTGCDMGFKLTGVKPATILTHVRDNKIIPANGYNFRYLDSSVEWPEHTNRHLQIYRKYPMYPPDGALMIDIKTGEEKFYLSASEAAQENNLSKRLIWDMISKKLVFKDRYIFKYFKLRETLGPAVA